MRSRRKKKPCPPCKKRKQGKCKAKLPDGTACSGGTCLNGSCRPASGPSDVSSPLLPPAPCAGLQDDALCDGGTGRCLNGVCNRPETCRGGRALCAVSSECCSKTCGGNGRCEQGHIGTACAVNADCLSLNCLGYRCVQGIEGPAITCFHDEACASNRCGCFNSDTGNWCMCRDATCVGTSGICIDNLDCCTGLCSGIDVNTGAKKCAQ